MHTLDLLTSGPAVDEGVRNRKGEHLGKIEEVMIDLRDGQVAYALLGVYISGQGKKLLPIPWQSLSLDLEGKKFILDMDRKVLENFPAVEEQTFFDKQVNVYQNGFFPTSAWEH